MQDTLCRSVRCRLPATIRLGPTLIDCDVTENAYTFSCLVASDNARSTVLGVAE